MASKVLGVFREASEIHVAVLGPAGKARYQPVWFFHGFHKTIVISGEMEPLSLFKIFFASLWMGF